MKNYYESTVCLPNIKVSTVPIKVFFCDAQNQRETRCKLPRQFKLLKSLFDLSNNKTRNLMHGREKSLLYSLEHTTF